MFKGNSTASLELISEGYKGRALRIQGTIGHQFAYPWAGVYLPFTNDREQGLELSQNQSINLWVKGSEGDFRLLLFSNYQAMRPIELPFTVETDWNQVNLSLSQIDSGLLKSISGIAFVAGSEMKDFQLVLDEIVLDSL